MPVNGRQLASGLGAHGWNLLGVSLTRERIRQIEAKALRNLGHPSRSRKLRSFLNG